MRAGGGGGGLCGLVGNFLKGGEGRAVVVGYAFVVGVVPVLLCSPSRLLFVLPLVVHLLFSPFSASWQVARMLRALTHARNAGEESDLGPTHVMYSTILVILQVGSQ